MPRIDRLLRPRSIAVVGASPAPGALGRSVIDNLQRARYSGAVHLVNPKRTEVLGQPCVATIADLPEGIDCVVLAIPGSAVIEAVRACGERGAGAVIIFSAGFAETGAEGQRAQAGLAALARHYDLIIEGPNCLGIVNYVDMIPLTFVQTPLTKLGDRRGIAIVSQSGAMAAVLGVTLQARDLGLSYSISTGNEAQSGVEDFVEYLLDDPHTAIIVMIAEHFRAPKRFLALARGARRKGIQITLLHPGRSAAARASAETHTGALAGDWDVMRAKVEQAGVALVATLEELVDVTEILARCPPMPHGGAAVIAESGAFKALALDFCDTIGLALPAPAPAAVDALRTILPPFIPPANPLDMTAQGLVDRDLYRKVLSPFLDDSSFACVLLTIILTDKDTCDIKLPVIIEALRQLRPKKPVVFAGLDEGAAIPPGYVASLRALGVPFFPTTERAMRAIHQVIGLAARDTASPPRAIESAPIIDLPPGTIPEYRAKEVLRSAGIPVAAGVLAASLGDALKSASTIGYPLVLKAQAAALSHKSDAGGVILNVAHDDDLRRGWARLQADVRAARPGVTLDGVLLEPMAAKGVELIAGGRNDPDWGPVILVGFGGVFAEAIRDVRLLPAGLAREAIAAEILTLKGARVFEGFRGTPPLDVGAVADIIIRLGALLEHNPALLEAEINPVAVYPTGALALDALMVIGPVDAAEDARGITS